MSGSGGWISTASPARIVPDVSNRHTIRTVGSAAAAPGPIPSSMVNDESRQSWRATYFGSGAEGTLADT